MLLLTNKFVVVIPKWQRDVPNLDVWAVHGGWYSPFKFPSIYVFIVGVIWDTNNLCIILRGFFFG